MRLKSSPINLDQRIPTGQLAGFFPDELNLGLGKGALIVKCLLPELLLFADLTGYLDLG